MTNLSTVPWSELWDKYIYWQQKANNLDMEAIGHVQLLIREIKERLYMLEAAQQECTAKIILYSDHGIPDYECGLHDAAWEINNAMVKAKEEQSQ